ncbi:MAG: hypothetical protein O7G85_15015, partial [Planctomycetota bacterium]|nr:hypothetical protein [Planctomycetota bacterium]
LEGDTGVNYYLTTGAADMTIGGGALVWVGSADPFDDPLNMVIGDALGINGGHMIIIAGSNVYAWSLSVGVIGGGSLDINDGSLTITGTGPHSLGVFGNADLEIWEDSFLTINGPVYLGVSSSISTSR